MAGNAGSFGNLIRRQQGHAAAAVGVQAMASGAAVKEPLKPSSGAPLVTSVFEVPPVGAIGVAPSGGTLTVGLVPPAETERGEFSYTVPNGRVFLLRLVEYWFYPIYPDSSLASPVSPLILVNGQREDVFQDTGKLQAAEAGYFKAFAAGSVITVRVDRTSVITWAVRYGGLDPALQNALLPTFNARLTGQLVAAEGLPTEKAQATRYIGV